MTARPEKHDAARALMMRGSVFVYLDPRAPGVFVPAWLAKQPQLVLQFGFDLPVPIPDLSLDEEGVSGTLSFNRQPFVCTVPWSAVFAMVGDDGMGMVWDDDLPEEIAEEVDAGFKRKSPSAGPSLRAIDGGRTDTPPPPPRSVTRALDLIADDEAEDQLERVGLQNEQEPDDRAPQDQREPAPADRDAPADQGDEPDPGDDDPPARDGLPPYLRVIK